MVSTLGIGLAYLQSHTALTEGDRLSVYSQALHYQASLLTGEVNLFTVSVTDETFKEVPFFRLKPLLADFPAPVIDSAHLANKSAIHIYVNLEDVVDSTHVLVNGEVFDARSNRVSSVRGVCVKAAGHWRLTTPALPEADQKSIIRAAILYLMAVKRYGYWTRSDWSRALKAPSYVGVLTDNGQTLDFGQSQMQELWRRGYHVSPASRIPPEQPPNHPPPYFLFSVGEVAPIDARRATVLLSLDYYNKEPGYNDLIGPHTGVVATYMATKSKGGWHLASKRRGWTVFPAE